MILENLSLDQIGKEANENVRFRAGLWLIALLVLVWLSLVWSDFNAAKHAELKQQQREVASLLEIESLATWQQRSNEMDVQFSKTMEVFWRADSNGLAMAKLQASLDEMIVKDEFVNMNIRVGTPQDLEYIDVSRVRAKIRVSLTGSQLLTTLQNIQANSEFLEIEFLDANFVKGRWVVDLTIGSYFVLSDRS